MEQDDQKPDDKKPPRLDSARLLRVAWVIFIGGVAGTVSVVYSVPEAQRAMMVGVAMAAFMGGGIKILSMLQVHQTDAKVNEDLKVNKSVENKLNGGFEDRVMGIFEKALDRSLPGAINAAMDERADKRAEKREEVRKSVEAAIKKD